MAWAGVEGAQEQHEQLVKVFLGNGRELAASEHVAKFWFCSNWRGVSDFEQRGCRLAEVVNRINTAGVPNRYTLALIWQPP